MVVSCKLTPTPSAQTVLHEVLESYNAMNIGSGVHTYGTADWKSTYDQAHAATNKIPEASTNAGENNIHQDVNSFPGLNTYFYRNPTTGQQVILFQLPQKLK